MLKTAKVTFLKNSHKSFISNCLNFFHSGNCICSKDYVLEEPKCLNWKRYNKKIYPPQSPDEPPRPAFVCHVKENVNYSYKKMWYIACFIRGMSIDEALKQLQFLQKQGSVIARETLLEAQRIAVEEHNVEFKSNLWVSESFVGKGKRLKGYRRSARGVMKELCRDYIHYFVTLEEGKPPEYYYHFKKPKTGEEMLSEWIQEMRNRKVLCGL